MQPLINMILMGILNWVLKRAVADYQVKKLRQENAVLRNEINDLHTKEYSEAKDRSEKIAKALALLNRNPIDPK